MNLASLRSLTSLRPSLALSAARRAAPAPPTLRLARVSMAPGIRPLPLAVPRWMHTSAFLQASPGPTSGSGAPQGLPKRDEDPAAAAAAATGVVMGPPVTKKKKTSVRRAGSGAASYITMDDEHVSDAIATNTQIVAFSTAQEYNLTSLLAVLDRTPGYTLLPKLAADVLHIRDDVAHDVHATGELFVFADGSFVAWGTHAQEIGSRFLTAVLKKSPPVSSAAAADAGKKRLGPIEVMPSKAVEMEEMEYIEDANETTGLTGDLIIIGAHPPPQLSKLAFSHGLSRSAKIAVLESLLDRYLGSTRHIPHMLAQGHALAMSRTEILQKIGELLSVRALLNLSGSPHGAESLLDTPEFYWSKPQLEEYYTKVTRWLDVKPRISLLNQKLDYASEFANVLRGHLSEQHSLKLEWFIIILIAIEVVFGLVEWAEKLGYVHLTGQDRRHEPACRAVCACGHAHHGGSSEFVGAPMTSDEALHVSGVAVHSSR